MGVPTAMGMPKPGKDGALAVECVSLAFGTRARLRERKSKGKS